MAGVNVRRFVVSIRVGLRWQRKRRERKEKKENRPETAGTQETRDRREEEDGATERCLTRSRALASGNLAVRRNQVT